MPSRVRLVGIEGMGPTPSHANDRRSRQLVRGPSSVFFLPYSIDSPRFHVDEYVRDPRQRPDDPAAHLVAKFVRGADRHIRFDLEMQIDVILQAGLAGVALLHS